MDKPITNKEFAENNEQFRKTCESIGLKITSRQASKWRRKQGKAWNERPKNEPSS